MKTWSRSFNIYLLLVAFLFSFGCASEASKKKKELCTFRVHLECNDDGTGRSGNVEVTSQKIRINVEREPFLAEDDVASASLVDSVGGFEVQVLLTQHGSLWLDMKTTSNKGRRMAILTQSQNKAITKSRWIAAPLIKHRISNGALIFTPDMTREEAEHFVNGLNNVAKKARDAELF